MLPGTLPFDFHLDFVCDMQAAASFVAPNITSTKGEKIVVKIFLPISLDLTIHQIDLSTVCRALRHNSHLCTQNKQQNVTFSILLVQEMDEMRTTNNVYVMYSYLYGSTSTVIRWSRNWLGQMFGYRSLEEIFQILAYAGDWIHTPILMSKGVLFWVWVLV